MGPHLLVVHKIKQDYSQSLMPSGVAQFMSIVLSFRLPEEQDGHNNIAIRDDSPWVCPLSAAWAVSGRARTRLRSMLKIRGIVLCHYTSLVF